MPLQIYNHNLLEKYKTICTKIDKHGIFELPHELPKDLRLRISGN